ncbi:CaiB/BaiF CoA transferase family protein [Paenibacillus naphthalenovorans]|uniref:Formyl-coenzyme A transferase n=1 Tax=Paenibacillus naphthalenovorans TaxID=162209 RepID=A0A0U2UIP8_9BACL|nr:CoA transferase [Paenibacillus naphthalenovorans]ALS21777.1 formyl-coenzyme A transferase [Paenibacillus naphthalenovorans]GCL71505.1 CoA transferase [Paenibacillus naphthalenovorans]SDI83009.1 Crotonobetainyl-CoA:carnitine CoA-transferase CaiB [Paenibacillus naphthalenovorans]
MSTLQGGPLSGLRVIEFGQIAAGPFTGMLLADLGADVVKVERPDSGDGMRDWPPFFVNEQGESYSANFASLNRNKRSITVDFKDPEQLEALRKLCGKADIIIENYRPGVLRKFGLGYDALSAENPGLVYCSISGYGQEGPYAQKGAFDVTIQAISGLMSVTGEETGTPVKCGVPIADFAAGLYGAYSIAVSILQASQSGKGAYIDCSMLGSVLGISALQHSEYYGNGISPKRLGTAHPRNAPYQGFYGSDKPFVIAAGNDKLWREVCEAADRPELIDDPRFVTQTLRAKNQKELASLLQQSFSRKTAGEWLKEFDRRGVPCAPINDYEDILHDPAVHQIGLVKDLQLPNGLTTRTVPFPVKVTGYDFSVYRHPPQRGEHTEEVFKEWLDAVDP